ncbi:MAG: HAD family hydrolase [Deltaproteobacteria bacterium]|nr:HAD family hydrolase [Deltaproteobacteria bacterium]
MRRYAAVLLDVDGTLVESNDAHAHCWAEVLEKHGYEVPYSRVRSLIGMGGDLLIHAVGGPEPGTRESEKIAKHRSELFLDHWLEKVRPLPKARELVLRLGAEGYRYAVASAASTKELLPMLELADLADLCPIRTTSSDVEESKPNPDIVLAALEKVHAERHRTVMIGDTPYDVMACRGASVDMIGVTTGGWSTEALAGATAVYAGPADLLARWADSPLA